MSEGLGEVRPPGANVPGYLLPASIAATLLYCPPDGILGTIAIVPSISFGLLGRSQAPGSTGTLLVEAASGEGRPERLPRRPALGPPVGTKLAVAGFSALAIAGWPVLYLFDPSTSALYPPRPFNALTGPWCPGCGTAHAQHELLRGDLVAAFGPNPLLVLMLPLLGYSARSYVALGLRGPRLPKVLASPLWGRLALG